MKQQKAWKPPAGYRAVQAYVSEATYNLLQERRNYFGRSLRAEIRTILADAAKEWIKQRHNL